MLASRISMPARRLCRPLGTDMDDDDVKLAHGAIMASRRGEAPA